jgi:hypothetical protein
MRTIRAIAVALVAALALAGCGGDTDLETTGEVTPDPAASPTEAGPFPTATPDGGAPTEVGGVDLGELEGSVPADCREALQGFADAQVAYTQATQAALTGETQDFAAIADSLQELTDAAPAEIREDFQRYTDELVPYILGVAELDLQPGAVPSSEQVQRIGQLAEELDLAVLEEAGANIEAYFTEQCQ